MAWGVFFHPEFEPEFLVLPEAVRSDLLAHLVLLERFGPRLGRPTVDTLAGSRLTNLKELRFRSRGGVWRFAFVFDPLRRAVVLCGGDKSGLPSSRFYDALIAKAEARYRRHIEDLED